MVVQASFVELDRERIRQLTERETALLNERTPRSGELFQRAHAVLARAYAGREPILKIFGSYHGHHDAVMVSIGVHYDEIGPPERPAQLPYGGGIPRATVELTHAVHFNDAEGTERLVAEVQPACVI